MAERPNDTQSWVLIVGSMAPAEPEAFQEGCRAVGEALARAGIGVVAGSFQPNTADAWVLRGVQRIDESLIRMVRPDEVEEVPPEFEKIPVHATGRPWAKARKEQLALANAVLVIGGGKGTRNASEEAEIPILPLPAFAGTGHSLWTKREPELREEGIAADLLESLVHWRADAPDATVRILQQLLGLKPTPQSFLITWDPERTSFASIAEVSEEVALSGRARMRWTASEAVMEGDRAFFMRHGDPAGVAGLGTVAGDPVEEPHWDPKRAEQGNQVWYAEIDWERLTEDPLVPLTDLIELTGNDELWLRPGNGLLVPKAYADRIEEHIANPSAVASQDSGQELDPKEGLVSIERLAVVERSDTVERLLQRTIERAAEPGGADAAVTATLLVLTLLLDEAEEESAAAFLRAQLVGGDRGRVEEALATYLPFYERQTGPALAQRREGAFPIGWISSPVADFLTHASLYARQVSNTSEIHTRHLVAAIIRRTYDATPAPGTRRLFDDFDASEESLVEGFLGWLDTTGLGVREDLELWKAVLKRSDGGAERTAALGSMPTIELESPHGEDLLGIDRDVNPLAAVMASHILEPPLAVGLFGDWGSGKSFFMEKLRSRVDFLADASRARAAQGLPHSFHTEVAQIWFNAWNYVEANLWASLVTHIFESLHRNFVPHGEDEQQWERLLQRLDEESTSGDQARKELAAAEEGLKEAKQERRTHWQAVMAASQALWEQLETADPKLKDLGKTLNVEDLRAVQESLLLRREEAGALLERLPLFRRNLLRGLGSLRSLSFSAAGLVLTPVLALVVVRVVSPETLEAFGQQIAVVLGLLGTVVSWLGSAFQKAAKVVDSVQAAETAVQNALDSGSVDASNLQEAERAMAAAKQKVEEREEHIERLRSELSELQPSRRLTSFLANRAESQDYRKHLGLPAMIRRDFEHLQALMDQMETEPFTVAPEVLRRLEAAFSPELTRGNETEPAEPDENGNGNGTPVEEEEPRETSVPPEIPLALREQRIYLPEDARVEPDPRGFAVVQHDDVDFSVHIARDGTCRIDWQRLKIDRIVLYIDDLDRCPSKRVVEVLQAVRLLLDFRLFVVVVGVDARWVTQALENHHQSQWQREDDGIDAPEPQDFLEKIFQIPLWLEPLEDDATKKYLTGLTEGTVRTAPARDDGERDAHPGAADGEAAGDDTRDGAPIVPEPTAAVPPVSQEPTATTPTVAPEQTAATPPTGATPEETLAAAAEGQPATAPGAMSDEAAGREGPGADAAPLPVSETASPTGPEPDGDASEDPGDAVMNPPGLEMEPWERDFMLELSGLLGRSPRAIKRFVNVYRLIRSSVPSGGLRQFTGTREIVGSYQAVQLLLAVIVGKPGISEDFFEQLRADHRGDLAQLARERTANEKLSPEKRQDWRDLLAFLAPEGKATAFSAGHYIVPEWFDRVSRYSFRVGRR